MYKNIILLILIFFFILSPAFVLTSLGQPPPPPPEAIPIDGGLFLLIAAGTVYGCRKLYTSEKNKNK